MAKNDLILKCKKPEGLGEVVSLQDHTKLNDQFEKYKQG